MAFERAARLTYAKEFDDRGPEIQALLHRHVVDLDRNPREIKRFLNVFRFYAYVSFWRRSGGVDAPDLDGVAKLAMLAVRRPHLLSMLGTGSQLADLEAAAGDDDAWAEVVRCLPEHVRDEIRRRQGCAPSLAAVRAWATAPPDSSSAEPRVVSLRSDRRQGFPIGTDCEHRQQLGATAIAAPGIPQV